MRSTLSSILGTIFLIVGVASCTGRDDEAAYNVLLVTMDTTRADHLTCYGYSEETTPHVDALAADAVRFEHAVSTSAVTPMSHASILTGLNPYRHGLRVFYGPAGHFLERTVPTLATILRAQGWRTGAFVSAYPASERFGLHWGFDTFQSEVDDSVMMGDPAERPPKDGFWQDRRTASAQRRADATTDQALRWLEAASAPFFLWVHYFDPHDPSIVPPTEVFDRFGLPRSPQRVGRRIYDLEIFFMDSEIGRLLNHLQRTGAYDRTIIVVVSDHGQGLGQHNWGAHRLLYQEQIRLPLILRLPEGPRGRTVPDIVRSIDVMPTVLEVLGIEPRTPVEGKSLIAAMQGREEEPRLAYAEALNTIDEHAPERLPEHQQDDLFCLSDGTWKLIYHKHHPENTELYHLPTDPSELFNVAGLHPTEARRLEETLKASGAMTVERREPEGPMDQEALEKLRSLGYVR